MALDHGQQRRISAAADKRRAVERRAAVNKMKEKPCADCGASHSFFVMDFDHRDPSTKEFTISGVQTRLAWDKLVAEIAKCDVVCANCHRLRTWTVPKKLTSRQQLVVSFKSVPCADCMGDYHYCQMDFDHVRGEKLGQVPKMGSEAAIKAEAAKCDVICANCHRVRSQAAGKGTARLRPEDLDMVWKHRSNMTPQTTLRKTTRPWYGLAGTMPDGVLAAQHGVTRNAVRNYRKKMNIDPYTHQGVRPEFKEVRCGA
jgi:hypothetical protein